MLPTAILSKELSPSRMGLKACILLMAAYVISGKLGLMLALPPGYASPIFPPAGIAVAAMLIGGSMTLPWIFTGSLLLNIWVGYAANPHLAAISLLAAVVIAVASMLQAAIGGSVLRRAIGYPTKLASGRDMTRFLLWTPVICLTSAGISVSGLWTLGVIDTAGFAGNLISWWVGDTLGVVVMLPLTMILAGEPRELWRSRMRTVAIPMLLIFSLFVLIFLKANQWEQADSLNEFRLLSQRALNQIQEKFDEQEFLLEQTAAMIGHEPNGRITRQDFHFFIKKALNRFSMIQAVEWAPQVRAAGRTAFETAQRPDFPDFAIRERNSAGQLQRAPDRPEFHPVTLVEPLAGNEAAVGFDLDSNPPRHEAVIKAFQQETAIISAPVKLVQERDQQAGVLLMLSVDRHDEKMGVVLTVLKMNDFMNKLLFDKHDKLYTRLIDLDAQKTIYDNFAPGAQQALSEFAFNYGTRHYRLETAPTPAYILQHRSWQSWSVLAAGILGTGLIGSLLLLGTGYTARIEEQVADRTRQLKESESRFRNTLENAPIGMAIIALDGRFLQVNRSLGAMLGHEKSELEKLSLKDVLHPDDIAGNTAHLQQLLSGEIDTYRAEKRYIRKDGSIVWVLLAASVECDDTGAPLHFIGQIEDISERKKAEEVMRVAAATFETHEAIMITDSRGQILRVNRAFQDITGYGAEEVIGKNPRILNSGRQDAKFYADMWAQLLNNGVWTGEIWDRRKNGQIYPKWLTITAVKDDAAQTREYVAIFSDITARKEAEEEIRNLAFYDALTRLPNRRLLLDRLRSALSLSARNGHYGAVLFLDMDKFKLLNDTLGHEYGDLLLIEVAKRIQSCVREIDTVARLGGDEFVILVEMVDDTAEGASQKVALIAEKIRASLAAPYLLGGHEHHSSTSIGVCLYHGNQESVDILIKHADMAMYQAKDSGRNAVRFFDPAMQLAVETRSSLEADLRRALSEKQLCLYYQMQVDNDRRPFGAEALIRWIHPQRGMVSPGQFIPIAEESSLILDIGTWVLDTACRQLALWSKTESNRSLVLAVNVSAQQFRQHNFVEKVVQALNTHHVEAARLKLELTESVVLNDVNDVVSKMHALKAIGIGLSMDDFGTGYSSLSYMKSLPLDQIKIDQSFVRDLATDPNDAVMVQTIIDLAQNFRLNVIAEGVETEAQFEFLKLNNCMAYQGYWFARPVPIDEFERLLQPAES